MLLPTLTKAVKSDVRVCVYTHNSVSNEGHQSEDGEAAINALQLHGVEVDSGEETLQRYAIIDEIIVWYGNIDFWAYGRKDSGVLRFKNADIALRIPT